MSARPRNMAANSHSEAESIVQYPKSEQTTPSSPPTFAPNAAYPKAGPVVVVTVVVCLGVVGAPVVLGKVVPGSHLTQTFD